MEYEARVKESQQQSMKEYMELKQFLLKRCQRFGGFFTIYILLVISGKAALCTMIGSAASYAYLAWLCRDVDAVTGQDRVPARDADAIRDPWSRRVAKVTAGYRQSLQPRLLVPICLAAGIWVYNSQSGDQLTVAEEGALLGGFLSYKIALILKVWDELRPRFDKGKARQAKRPQFEQFDDKYDMYGREKVVPKGVEEAERILREQEEAKARKRGLPEKTK